MELKRNHVADFEGLTAKTSEFKLLKDFACSGSFRLCYCLSKLAGSLNSDVFYVKPLKSATWFPLRWIVTLNGNQLNFYCYLAAQQMFATIRYFFSRAANTTITCGGMPNEPKDRAHLTGAQKLHRKSSQCF
jgi:hypothetical protein